MSATRRLILLAALASPGLAASRAATAAEARPTVVIESFEGSELTGGTVTAASLISILTELLTEDGGFDVLEPPGTGARFILRGAITRFDPTAGGAGVSIGGFSALGRRAGAGAKVKSTMVGLSVRLVESVSGIVVAAARAEASATGREADAGLLDSRDGSTIGATAFRSTSVAQAFETAMRRVLEEIKREARLA